MKQALLLICIAGCNLDSSIPARAIDARDVDAPVLGVDAPPDAPSTRCSNTTTFGTPRPIPELTTAGRTDQFAVTADELEVYYTGVVSGSSTADIFHAKRASRTDPWNAGQRVAAISTAGDDPGVRISPDGLQLFLDRGGDLVATTRTSRTVEFTAPTTVANINSASDERWLSIDATNRVIYYESDRNGGNRRLFRAERASPAAAFDPPVLVGGTADLFSPLVTDDGLTMYFGVVGAGNVINMFQSTRASTSDPFGPARQLHEFDDVGGWPSSISPDGCRLYMLRGTHSFPDVLPFVAERPLP